MASLSVGCRAFVLLPLCSIVGRRVLGHCQFSSSASCFQCLQLRDGLWHSFSVLETNASFVAADADLGVVSPDPGSWVGTLSTASLENRRPVSSDAVKCNPLGIVFEMVWLGSSVGRAED